MAGGTQHSAHGCSGLPLTLSTQAPAARAPIDWIAQAEPIEVAEGTVARCYGGACAFPRVLLLSRHRCVRRCCLCELQPAPRRLTASAAAKDPSLGHPVEFIVLNDTSREHPAVCKYCGAHTPPQLLRLACRAGLALVG